MTNCKITECRNKNKDSLRGQPTVTCTATKESPVGNYPVTVSEAVAQNYEISYVNGTLIITEADAVIVTARSYQREYGEENPVFDYDVEGADLVGTPEITCEATATSPVGTYPIVIKKGSVTNYNDTYIYGTLTITKAPLIIKAGTYSKEQGEENPEFILEYVGFKNDETEDVLTTQPITSCEATKDSPAGEYIVSISGADALNYEISYENGLLIITEPADIQTIKETTNSKVIIFSMDGRKIKTIPQRKGVYIVNGQKVMVKQN